jgi:vacuolar-type H+-ATPase subunit F/Vma7
MSRVAVLGAEREVEGYALAGALVLTAATPDAVRAAWAALPADVALVLLTAAAADALDSREAGDRLTVVLP